MGGSEKEVGSEKKGGLSGKREYIYACNVKE